MKFSLPMRCDIILFLILLKELISLRLVKQWIALLQILLDVKMKNGHKSKWQGKKSNFNNLLMPKIYGETASGFVVIGADGVWQKIDNTFDKIITLPSILDDDIVIWRK